MSSSVSVRLSDILVQKIDIVARETERPRSFIIQKAIEYYLEEYMDLIIALDRLRDKGDQTITGKELRKRVGI